MNLFRRWLEKLFGLRVAVEDEVEKLVRANAVLAGALARAQAAQEAEAHAVELQDGNPQLAAFLRAAIAEQLGTPLSARASPPAEHDVPPSTRPPLTASAEAPVRKSPGRPKKTPALPAPTTSTGDN